VCVCVCCSRPDLYRKQLNVFFGIRPTSYVPPTMQLLLSYLLRVPIVHTCGIIYILYVFTERVRPDVILFTHSTYTRASTPEVKTVGVWRYKSRRVLGHRAIRRSPKTCLYRVTSSLAPDTRANWSTMSTHNIVNEVCKCISKSQRDVRVCILYIYYIYVCVGTRPKE